jgi:putative FmdB family regulatory protein
MPVYVYACPACGRFELARPMARAGQAACCPECRREARRVFTPPNRSLLTSEIRRALGAEEASAHDPRVGSQKRGRPVRHRPEPTPRWVLH